jgi:hypothetical protein
VSNLQPEEHDAIGWFEVGSLMGSGSLTLLTCLCFAAF